MMTTNSHPSCSTRDAARALGVGARTVGAWVRAGHLRGAETVDGGGRVTTASVDALLARRDAVPAGEAFDILVVEDDRLHRRFLQARLREIAVDISVRTASNGFEGLMRISERTPQLLITDLVMPHFDGFRMLAILSAAPALMKTIAITALSPGEIAAQARLPAAVTVFHKPLHIHPLVKLARAYHQLWGLAGHGQPRPPAHLADGQGAAVPSGR